MDNKKLTYTYETKQADEPLNNTHEYVSAKWVLTMFPWLRRFKNEIEHGEFSITYAVGLTEIKIKPVY